MLELNKPLIIDEVSIPKLDVGQVLVEIHYSGICGAQLGEISGAKGEDKFLPHLLGHEGSGIVVDVGPGVKLREEDNVVAHWREGKGIDANFPIYKWNDILVGGGKVTTFGEYVIISENRLTKIDTFIPLEKAAGMGCSITTAFGLINNEAKLKIGQRVMVIGCGGVGLNVIQAAKLAGAGLVIGVDSNSFKSNKITKMGASYSSLIPKHDLNIDIVIDTTGISSMIEQGWIIAKEKMILVGQPHFKESFTFRNVRDTFFSGKIMMDSQGGLTNPNIDIPRYLDMGDKIINENTFYSLENINKAINDMNKGIINKPMLEMR